MNHFDKELNDLVAKGRSQGYLTYDEVAAYLPDEAVDPEKIDSLLISLDERNIPLLATSRPSRNSSTVKRLPVTPQRPTATATASSTFRTTLSNPIRAKKARWPIPATWASGTTTLSDST